MLVRNTSYYGDRLSFWEHMFSSCAELVTCTVVAFHHKSLLSVQQQNCAELQSRVEKSGSLSSGSVQGKVLLLGTVRPRQVKRSSACALL